MKNPSIQRMTIQRQIILDELSKVKSHPTADEIYRMVRKKIPNISLGTVYRNLEIMAEAGLILKLESAGSQRRYDADTSNHYHLRCIKCGRVIDIMMAPIEAIKKVMEEFKGCTIRSYKLEFTGTCEKCDEESPGEGGKESYGV